MWYKALKKRMTSSIRLLSLLLFSLILTACGGSTSSSGGGAAADITPPVLTLLGNDPVTLALNETYNDAGATATDDVDGDLTASITITGFLNSAVLGTYILTYNVSDAAGNAADSVSRTVEVVGPVTQPLIVDGTAPSLSLSGFTGTGTGTGTGSGVGGNTYTMTHEVGTPFTAPSATAVDGVDGDLSAQVTMTGSVNSAVIGTYTLTYSVSDAAGNSITITLIVEVVAAVVVDGTAPSLSLSGFTGTGSGVGGNTYTMTHEVGTPFTAPSATAVDGVDGYLSAQVTMTGSVNSAVIGTYTLTYSVSDAAGNSITITLIVEVVAAVVVDGTAPSLSLSGFAGTGSGVGGNTYTMTHEVGTPFTAPSATAMDGVDGDLSAQVTMTGSVDSAVIGTYTLTYSVSDAAGNSTTIILIVDVVAAVVAPATGTGLLNDTGITWGGNYPTGNNATCIGQTVAEQDCSHGRDAQAAAGTLVKVGGGAAGFDFTKLDAAGAVLPATATAWSCVRDNHTGLVWEVKTPAGSGSIHDTDKTYRWGGKTERLIAAFGTSYGDWNVLLDGSNAGTGLCGFTDWRVPTVMQLLSIVNKGVSIPAIDSNYFPNSGSGFYWSSSPLAAYSNFAWGVLFYLGYGDGNLRDASNQVRLVRGGE